MTAKEVTRDRFFDGRLVLTQPGKGHRSGTDAVLLAAAVPHDFHGLVVDAGAGVGVVGLGVALACSAARVTLVEIDPTIAGYAADNIATNGLGDRVNLARADLLSSAERRQALPDAADIVLTNPPFYAAAEVRASSDAGRRTAHVLPDGVGIDDWIVACLDGLGAKGVIVAICPAASLTALLAALKTRAGGITLKSVHPRAGVLATRLLVRATKGSRAPLAIASPLVLHEGDRFTDEADALHKGRREIVWT